MNCITNLMHYEYELRIKLKVNVFLQAVINVAWLEV